MISLRVLAASAVLLTLLWMPTTTGGQSSFPEFLCHDKHSETQCLAAQYQCAWCNITNICLDGSDIVKAPTTCCAGSSPVRNCPRGAVLFMAILGWALIVCCVIIVVVLPAYCLVAYLHERNRHLEERAALINRV